MQITRARRVDDGCHAVLAVRARVLRAVNDDGIGVVDGHEEDVVLFPSVDLPGYMPGGSKMNGVVSYVRSALRRGEESRKESAAVRLGHTARGPRSLNDAVVPRPEAELEHISFGGCDRVGREGEAVSTNRDGDCGGAGPQSEHNNSEDGLTEHP